MNVEIASRLSSVNNFGPLLLYKSWSNQAPPRLAPSMKSLRKRLKLTLYHYILLRTHKHSAGDTFDLTPQSVALLPWGCLQISEYTGFWGGWVREGPLAPMSTLMCLSEDRQKHLDCGSQEHTQNSLSRCLSRMLGSLTPSRELGSPLRSPPIPQAPWCAC